MQDDFPGHRFFKVEKVVEKVLKENRLEEVLYFTRILNHWDVIVGNPLSKRAVPLKLVKRVLYVGVVDSAYSHHLRFFEANILELIASPEICGEGAVRKIVFRTVRRKISNRPIPEHPATPENSRSLSKAEKSRVEGTARHIKDTYLKKMFTRYMGKVVSK